MITGIKYLCKTSGGNPLGVSCKLEWKGKNPKEIGFGFIAKERNV
jgi:hypothetical protein